MVYSPPVQGPTAWPARPPRGAGSRAPRWLLLGAALTLVVITVLAGLAGRPAAAPRATDLRRFLHDMPSDIQSCAGGVSEALNAVRAIPAAGTGGNRATAIDE